MSAKPARDNDDRDYRLVDGARLRACCLITTAANELVKPYHDRMPAILSPGDYDAWLDPDAPADRLLPLLRPYPAEDMRVAAARAAVNSPRNDGPECLAG